MKNRFLRAIAWILLCWTVVPVDFARAYEEDPGINGTTVRGRVTITGAVPKLKPLMVPRDSDVCGATIPNEVLQVDQASRGIAAVVVSLEGVAKGKPYPKSQSLVVLNLSCRFQQRANATTVGNPLVIWNKDPIMHNTHIRRETKFGSTVLNVVQPVGTRPITRDLQQPDFLDVRCDAHPFMHASIHVFEHPYFAVTDGAGWFELTTVPPGTYQLHLWHELLSTRQETINIPANGDPVTVTLEMAAEG